MMAVPRGGAMSGCGTPAAIAIALCVALGGTAVAYAQTTVEVADAAGLETAVANANRTGGNVTILLGDGTYTLSNTLNIVAPSVVLAGKSADARLVVVQGDAMSATARVGTLVRAAAARFELRHITLQRSRNHLIQIVGEEDADDARVSECVLRDAYEQLIKVSMDMANSAVTADRGTVENCSFEYTAGIGPQYYIGGIDAHGAKDWLVRGNTFRAIASPNTSIAEFAIHFWNTSSNNTVERNLIIDCDRGIGFGLDGRPNRSGIIRNNMIYHSANTHRYADTGIALMESPDTAVYNNTVFLEHAASAAIEYRFASTQNVQIFNNVTNKPIRARDGATGIVTSNRTNAVRGWFVYASRGDLHLAGDGAGVIDAGRPASELADDFDGQRRPRDRGIDIGADERL
jgi:hypothetical protein